MQLQRLIEAMETIAPTGSAEPWDNVGLIAGDPKQSVTRAMLTIDYTAAVADEAKAAGCDVILAYHPPLFQPVNRITADGPTSLIHDAIRRGIAIYSPHTALDAADGGTNDVLADVIGLVDRLPLRLAVEQLAFCKLVVFIPESHFQQVSSAVFNAGAGKLGNYSSCGFQSRGTGTFLPEPGANPAIGQVGKLETTAEIRFETIVPMSAVSAVVRAMRDAHPYEEPAFDLNELVAEPSGIGSGRIGNFTSPKSVTDLIETIKKDLNLDSLLVAGPADRSVTRAAVCAGAGGEMLDDAIRQKAELYLTGELRHHDVIKASRAGMTTICTLHSNCERPALKRLKSRLESMLPAVQFLLSQADRDPFSIV